MEMAWQKRKRLSEEHAKEILQASKEAAKEALQADKEAAKESRQNVENALQAANEAGSTVRNLYITFLLLGVYIGIIIASTTDRQLLLISPVTLPLLNVQLPILGFYIFVPWLFLLVHFDLLLQLFLLSDKLRVFAQASVALQAEEAEALRKQLISFPTVQMLANLQYDRLIQWLLALVVWTIVLILPLGLLLWAQLRFLPYHNADITWGHRAAVLLDAIMLLLFWPRLISGKGIFGGWRKHRTLEQQGYSHVKSRTGVVLLGGVVITLALSWLVATVPEEPWEAWLLAHMPAGWKSLSKRSHPVTAWGEAQPLPERSQQPVAFYPTFLLLEGEHKMLSHNLHLQEQLLTANELSADVQHALLKGTAQQREQGLQKVQGLNLQGRDLRYVILTRSLLPDADLRGAQLQGAHLWRAQLQGADLRDAQLQGANLSGAQLQDADMNYAQLQGAILSAAQLQGAILDYAQLQGADLSEAQLQVADLSEAQLQGAILNYAQLQGANMEGAQLQGANMEGASIGGAFFKDARLDLADLSLLDLSEVITESYETRQMEKGISDPQIRKNILERLERLNGKPGRLDGIASASQCLSDVPKLLLSCFPKSERDNYLKAQADFLVKQVACSAIDAAQGILLRALRLSENEANRLAATLLTADCEPVKTATSELSGKDKQALEGLARKSQ